MTFKQALILERLKALAETISRLKQLQQLSIDELKKDFRNYWSVERGFQIAAEALFDIGNHILAGHFHAAPKDYEEIIQLLGDREVIAPELKDQLKGLGGFRNILVHDYLDVDPTVVFDRLQSGLTDFEEFARQILSWMDKNRVREK
jgi:uncharacterized protein YutE (UPF0331/DUF86 family)